MKLSTYQQAIIKDKEAQALKLYSTGLSLAKVGDAIGKSNTWVWLVMRKYGILPVGDNSKK